MLLKLLGTANHLLRYPLIYCSVDSADANRAVQKKMPLAKEREVVISISVILLVKRFRLWCSFSPPIDCWYHQCCLYSIASSTNFCKHLTSRSLFKQICNFSVRKIFCILDDFLWWDIAFSSKLLVGFNSLIFIPAQRCSNLIQFKFASMIVIVLRLHR